jgi:hypothetical protein
VWEVAEGIMIPKPGKPPHEDASYRPISLLPVMSKLFEKLLIKRLKPIIEKKNLIPNHQFGFRSKHWTIDQVHRITSIVENALEEKKVCSAVFLDVAQAFDNMAQGTKLQAENYPTLAICRNSGIIFSREIQFKQGDAYSELKEIKAGVPQGSVLGPILYLLCTSDLSVLESSTVATFADDTVILAIGSSNEESTEKLRNAKMDKKMAHPA